MPNERSQLLKNYVRPPETKRLCNEDETQKVDAMTDKAMMTMKKAGLPILDGKHAVVFGAGGSMVLLLRGSSQRKVQRFSSRAGRGRMWKK
jgi:hypothetical protein